MAHLLLGFVAGSVGKVSTEEYNKIARDYNILLGQVRKSSDRILELEWREKQLEQREQELMDLCNEDTQVLSKQQARIEYLESQLALQTSNREKIVKMKDEKIARLEKKSRQEEEIFELEKQHYYRCKDSKIAALEQNLLKKETEITALEKNVFKLCCDCKMT